MYKWKINEITILLVDIAAGILNEFIAKKKTRIFFYSTILLSTASRLLVRQDNSILKHIDNYSVSLMIKKKKQSVLKAGGERDVIS